MAEESAEATSDNRLYGQLENWWSERLKIWNTLCTPSWKGYCRTREVLRWVTRRIKGLGKLSCEESLKRQRLLPWRGDGWRGDWCNAAGSGSSGRKGKRYFSLKCIKDKRIPITVTVVITALIITVIALAGSLPPAHAAHPTSLLRARTAGWDTKGNATTSRRLKGTGTTARATALPSTPPWLPLIQCRSWISCCAIKGSLTTGLASGGNKARASPGSGPTVSGQRGRAVRLPG
ncbi:uncharacterized protein ACDP82_015924 isoform 3-T4 [Pangshura tecta]